jgi:hypothetical protein
MTIPAERHRALLQARKLLFDLLDPDTTPRVPKSVRIAAGNALKHYPDPLTIAELVYDNDSCTSFGGLGDK